MVDNELGNGDDYYFILLLYKIGLDTTCSEYRKSTRRRHKVH